MKYFAIFDENVATIFQLQWNIGNSSNIFLQYSVLCGKLGRISIIHKKSLTKYKKKKKRVTEKLFEMYKKTSWNSVTDFLPNWTLFVVRKVILE